MVDANATANDEYRRGGRSARDRLQSLLTHTNRVLTIEEKKEGGK